jgi:hypothetical protein
MEIESEMDATKRCMAANPRRQISREGNREDGGVVFARRHRGGAEMKNASRRRRRAVGWTGKRREPPSGCQTDYRL